MPLSERKAETRATSDIKAVCRLCAGSRAYGGKVHPGSEAAESCTCSLLERFSRVIFEILKVQASG